MNRHCLAAFFLLIFATAVRAEDQYFSVPLSDLVPAEKLPAAVGGARHWSTSRAELFPHVVLKIADSEAYAKTPPVIARYWTTAELLRDARITCRLPKLGPVTGTIFLPNSDMTLQIAVLFTYAPGAAAHPLSAKTEFLQAKQLYYFNLAEEQLPGGAWFRHQEHAAAAALGENKLELTHSRYLNAELDTSDFALLAGRTVAENFQLERAFIPRNDARTVDIATLEGIPSREFDWAPLLKDKQPDLDPLASLLPADQFAVFFPNLASFSAFVSEADRDLTPFRGIASHRNMMNDHIFAWYSHQLCLPLREIDKHVAADLVSTVAITGDGPSLSMGSTVAILFESRDPIALWQQLQGIMVKEGGNAKMSAAKTILGGASILESEDRSISVTICKVGNAVLVTNSHHQLSALAEVQANSHPLLGSLDEYRFMRTRYPRSDKEETAFFVISEPTIRRWCSPQIRIASEFRIRAAAILAEMETAALANPEAPIDLPSDFKLAHRHDLGSFSRVNTHIKSENYNTLEFLTPADELDVKKVTPADAAAYKRWRDTFQSNYRRYFDPVAVRVSLQKDSLAADFTMMPLPKNSFYQLTFGTYLKGKFAPGAADPHDALFQLVLGVDTNNPPLSELIPKFLPLPGTEKGVNPLRWLGNNASLYIEDDPIWQELAKLDLKSQDAQDLLRKNASRLPVAARFASNNPFGQAAFVVAATAYLDTVAPGAFQFTSLTYHDQPYVKIAPAKPDPADTFKAYTWYYLSTPDSLLISINEPLIHRLIDRRAAATQPENQKSKIKNQKWLGQTLAAHLDANLLRLAIQLSAPNQVQRLQQQSWAAIPVLNDLKRLRPNEDAVALYSKTFHQTPTDPLGGTYAWDEKLQTYTSTTLGDPAAPKSPSPIAPILLPVKSLDFGLTMEENSLRLRTVIHRTP